MGWYMFGVGAIAFLAVAASGCGGGSDAEPTPTAVNRLTPAASTTVVRGAGGPPAGFTPGARPPAGFTPGAGFNGTPPTGAPGIRLGANTPIAEFLGITEDELATALQEEGATLVSVAEDHGKSRDALKEFFIADAGERLGGQVEDGTLSQEEADAQLERLRGSVDMILDGSGAPMPVPEATP